MGNLLSAHLFRLRRSPLFWGALAVCLGAGVLCGGPFGGEFVVDDYYFFPLFVTLCAFLSLFFGRMYSDGTMRNQVSAGCRRGQIYGSQLLLALLVALLCLLATVLPIGLLNGARFLRLEAGVLGAVLLGLFLLTAALAAMFTAVSTCISSRAVGVVMNLCLWLGMMMGAYQLEFALGQPELVGHVQVVDSQTGEVLRDQYGAITGSELEGEPLEEGTQRREIREKNPHYLDAPLRQAAQAAELLLPHGQMNAYVSYLSSYLYAQENGLPDQGAQEEEAILRQGPLGSLATLALSTGLGLAVFRRKDLK